MTKLGFIDPSLLIPEPNDFDDRLISWESATLIMRDKRTETVERYLAVASRSLSSADAAIENHSSRFALLGAVIQHGLKIFVGDLWYKHVVRLVPTALSGESPTRVLRVDSAMSGALQVDPTIYPLSRIERRYVGCPLYLVESEFLSTSTPSDQQVRATIRSLIDGAVANSDRYTKAELTIKCQEIEPFTSERSIHRLWSQYAPEEWQRVCVVI